jgi:hypothetical protein
MIQPNNSGRRIPRVLRALLWVIGGLTVTATLLLLVVPTLDGPHSRLLANEASAVSKLRTIITLQDRYSAAHAYGGFACDLPLLKPVGEQTFPDQSLGFLITGVRSGYTFSMVNCGPDANRAGVHYQVIAVPVEKGTTGVRTFCADESGVIWYDSEEFGTRCLTSRHPLE